MIFFPKDNSKRVALTFPPFFLESEFLQFVSQFCNLGHIIKWLLCEKHVIVVIQEHWLLPLELEVLSNLHDDYLSVGISAVDTSSDIRIGQPYGSTAVLYSLLKMNYREFQAPKCFMVCLLELIC